MPKKPNAAPQPRRQRSKSRADWSKAQSDGFLREKAYNHIQRKIMADELAAGSVVSEIALAREIGISRTPVREAIGQLVAVGLLERVAARSVVVTRPQRSDIVELYELREALEVYAVGKAARQGMPAADLAVLHRLCEEVRELAEELRRSGRERLSEELMQRFVAADMGFHMLLLRAAGNRRIAKVAAETRLLVRIFSYKREGRDARLLENIYRYHKDVLEAVEAHDAQRAIEQISEHIQVSMQERLATYDRWERQHELDRLAPLAASIVEQLERAGATGRA